MQSCISGCMMQLLASIVAKGRPQCWCSRDQQALFASAFHGCVLAWHPCASFPHPLSPPLRANPCPMSPFSLSKHWQVLPLSCMALFPTVSATAASVRFDKLLCSLIQPCASTLRFNLALRSSIFVSSQDCNGQ